MTVDTTDRQHSVRSDLLAMMAVAGVIWGFLFIFAGVPWAATWPWSYSLLSLLNWWLHERRGSDRALDAQLLISLVVPFVLMLHLGGFQASGGVVLWSLLSPIAAVLAHGVRQGRWWFLGYTAMLTVGIFLGPSLGPLGETLSETWIPGFWFGNVLGVTLTAWMVIARDASQRASLIDTEREARLLAEDATRAKSAFLANMSHELRTPMNAVIGMNGLLASTDLDDEQREYVTVVHHSAEVLLATINDVLDFSKMESDKFEIEPRTTVLRDLIEASVDVVAPIASQKRLDLVYDIRPDVPVSITTDGHRLRQILVNLLSNAVKFTERGEVSLEVRLGTLDDGEDAVILTVRDTGIGIPQEAIDTLFDSFQQVDPSTSRRYGGSGLGLAISKSLAELLGGDISVTSKEDAGSVFTVRILAKDPVFGSTEPEEASALEDRVMLVVLDNPTDQSLLVGFGEGWGMEVICVGSMGAALEAAQAHRRIDVVLIDHEHMVGDGVGLARRLESEQRTANVPLVLVSSAAARSLIESTPFRTMITRPLKQSAVHDVLMDVLIGRSRQVAPSRFGEMDVTTGARKPLRVLVAEDNTTNQRLILRLLERLGYDAVLVSDGVQVLEAVGDDDYDVILMDMQMPRMDGLEATRKIRTGSGHQPTIVAVTANATPQDREAAAEAGMEDYLTKPIRVPELTAALDRVWQSLVKDGATSQNSVATDSSRVTSVVDPTTDPVPGMADRKLGAIDPASLAQLVELTGDQDFVTTLLGDFIDEADRLVSDIHTAAGGDEEDDELLLRSAHSLKSSAASVGATDLAECAADIEHRAKNGDTADLKTVLDQLDRITDATKEALVALGRGVIR